MAAALVCGSLGALAVAAMQKNVSDDSPQSAKIDIGYGPGVTGPVITSPISVLNGGASAGVLGQFSAPFSWPIVPIHVMLLPDGRLLSYGTNANGGQNAAMIYDVWTPATGVHLTLPNTAGTNIFCSAQTMMWQTGTALISGGSITVGGIVNNSIQQTTVFDPSSNSISNGPSMAYPRWYASPTDLPNGDYLVMGGRLARGEAAGPPEVYDQLTGWRTLTGAAMPAADITVAGADYWWYPQDFIIPSNGAVFWIGNNGTLWLVDPTGGGTLTKLPEKIIGEGQLLPSAMYSSGKILSLRGNGTAVTIDINGTRPVISATGNLSQVRAWANATLLADGQVVVTGGSAVDNQEIQVGYDAETWNPVTGQWTLGAAAAKPRMYHSTAILLPDGSVFTGGGGSPGPVDNFNGEIYYPPYLFLNDGSGDPAPRPSLSGAPATTAVGSTITATVGSADTISRMTFVRTGSATHSRNFDQQFFDLGFSQNGQIVTAQLPSNANALVPGYYMLFAFNQAGVPSVAQIILVHG